MPQTLAYVSCAESREIQVFSLADESGEISLRQQLATVDSPLPLKISPDGRVLYAGTRSENGLLAFAVDQGNGHLTPLGGARASGRPAYVACDRAMQVAFLASYGDDRLEVFPLDANGAPRAASQVEMDLPHAHAALMDLSNRWLLVPVLGADAIRVYRLDGTRLLANTPPATSARPGCGPRHPVMGADNRYLHCLNELDGSIDLYAFDATAGTLTPQQSISILPPAFAEKAWAAELRATPDGRFLYASDRRASVIAAFAVDRRSGQLQLIDHYPTETQPRGMGIAPSGRWLIAAGELSGHLTVYAIDPENGRLAARHRQATGLDPICVELASVPGDSE